jgi:hypothetical protein
MKPNDEFIDVRKPQLGCKVIACHVSAAALEIGRELYSRNPPAGDRPTPEFLLFDGHRIDIADASVDRD